MTEEADERKEAISVTEDVNVIEATVIIKEMKMTEGVEIDVNKGLDKIVTLVFTCAFLICLCMRFFNGNFSSHVLHSTFTLFIKDLSLLSFH